ncbi:MAG: FAD-dependent oxidoreductase [Synechococcaceae cyanobacterium]|nr:FAD-dependent oxidoreductase [Synechococcaceae cyanobacterium]
MLRLSELKLPLEHDEADLREAILRRLRLAPEALKRWQLVRRSVDARRRDAIALVYAVDLDLALSDAERQRLLRRFAGDPHLRPSPDSRYRQAIRASADDGSERRRPLVVGAGPCGYFCALLLAQMGLRPLLLERGRSVKERTADTFGFWRGERNFDPESNAQFGEGGAGTFSDGKLYSQISASETLIRKVLEELVAAGASREILTLQRPHIGTFRLATVVRGLRRRIEELGGDVWFGARVSDLILSERERQMEGVLLADGRRLEADQVVLAVGHSARDTMAMLQRHGVALCRKGFAVGLRIEHPQGLIDQARWGASAGHPRLGPAEYKLVHHTASGRAVYSFCMCPGGLVVGATSEPGCVVTNGMSQHSRNERNANSGLVVAVSEAEMEPWGAFPGDPLAGIAFQRHWEARAFEAGGCSYRAPAQWLEDFLAERPSGPAMAHGVTPSYLPGVRLGSLDGCLPDEVLTAIREALPAFERSLPGYCMPGALLTGVETRTSSPVRITRQQETLQSINTIGLYPAGEGAGYAGGILSAAIDGIRVAEAVAITLPHPRRPSEPGESGGSGGST